MTTFQDGHGYRIDHIPMAQRCCDLHNVNCEPPAELCCDDCTELRHAYHGEIEATAAGDMTQLPPTCVLARCDCPTEQAHLDATRTYTGSRPGMREPKPPLNIDRAAKEAIKRGLDNASGLPGYSEYEQRAQIEADQRGDDK